MHTRFLDPLQFLGSWCFHLFLIHYNTCMLMTALHLVLGIISAWLVNYLSDVLPLYRKFVSPPCINCQNRLDWRFYIAFVPCQDCGAKPSLRHWLVMIIVPVLAVLLRFFPAPVLGQVAGVFWLAYFVLIVVIDMEYRLILHPVSFAARRAF